MIVTVRASSRRKQRKAFKSRAWLNGVEVTNRCFYADDRNGVVRCFRVNAEGRQYLDATREGVAVEELHGRVVIARRGVAR